MADPAPVPADDEERLEISDIAALKAMADPLRVRLLLDLSDRGPKTVKEIAAYLGVPQTRLYYHVRLLEKAGLIRVASTRMVSGIEERSYAAAAKSFGIAPELLGDPAVSDLLKAMFDLTRAQLTVALADPSGVPFDDPAGSAPILTFTRLFFTPTDVAEFQRRMLETFAEFGVPRPGAVEYGGVFALYRLGVGQREASADAP